MRSDLPEFGVGHRLERRSIRAEFRVVKDGLACSQRLEDVLQLGIRLEWGFDVGYA
jgi:hypothetical protein